MSQPTAITRQQADTIAARVIHEAKPSANYVILADHTVERDFGWVYFYVPKRYIETGDPNSLVPGAGPLIVLREDGSTQFVSTSLEPSRAIDIFEHTWRETHGIK